MKKALRLSSLILVLVMLLSVCSGCTIPPPPTGNISVYEISIVLE